MSSMVGNKGYVPRISQLDSLFLNREAYSMVKNQLLGAVKYIGQTFVTILEPEIDAALQYLILKYTVEKGKSSVGQQLLQIKYEETVSTRRLHSYIIMLVVGNWIKHRAGLITYTVTKNESVKEATSQCLSGFEIVFKVLQVINLLVFLQKGSYPTVLERLFGLRNVPANPGSVRRISYTYFTRELLWHGFAELLAFILPLINVQYFHSIVRKFVPSSSENDHSSEDEPKAEFVLQTTCVVCNNNPVLPHSFGCCHIACYYCVYSSYSSDPLFSCPLCGHQIENKVQIVPTYVS
ncbi:peroxisome biogenesis factor 2-like [Homarus americanus]|uniref:peroxisome biogenesis factor 2-like n=1 Tax=Homarus americanus TaxID=6706 RepID=UPI001C492B55|nr:peroxisome biogenesis factor 2-like [Homarus americanus]